MQNYFKYSAFIALSIVLTVGAGCSLLKNGKTPSTNTNQSNTNVSVDATNTDTDTDAVLSLDDEDATADTSQTTTDTVTTDVFGEDMELVQRYPDSVRSYYSKNELETDITYQTTASQDDVRKFYKEALTKDNAWTVSEEATDYVEFSRGDDNNPEYLTVYLTPYKNLLEYELVYEPPYTEEQLKQLESSDDSTDIDEDTIQQ